MDITKTLGNNALLRFGTRLRVLQNVIKILLMGQRGVETHGRKAARSRRTHMGAGRPCVQRGEGGRQPRQAFILQLLSHRPFLTCLSPSWTSGSASLHLSIHPSTQLWGCPSTVLLTPLLCPLPNKKAGVQALMGSVWETKSSLAPGMQVWMQATERWHGCT